MTYQFDFEPIFAAWRDLADGVWLTLQMSLISMIICLAIALVTVWARVWGSAIPRSLATIFVEIIRNTPFLVQIFFLFFGLPGLGVRLTPQEGAIIALSLNGGAYASEIIRGGWASIPKGQIEAGVALGLSRFSIFRHVVLKPALRSTYPSLCGQFILLILTSSITSSISARELTSVAQQLESSTFRSFEVYLSVTVIYLLISLVMSTLLKIIGRFAFAYPTR